MGGIAKSITDQPIRSVWRRRDARNVVPKRATLSGPVKRRELSMCSPATNAITSGRFIVRMKNSVRSASLPDGRSVVRHAGPAAAR